MASNAREERGLIIAATCRLNRMSEGTWLVPSQTKAGEVAAYRVNLEAQTCTCLDHTDGGFPGRELAAYYVWADREAEQRAKVWMLLGGVGVMILGGVALGVYGGVGAWRTGAAEQASDPAPEGTG